MISRLGTKQRLWINLRVCRNAIRRNRNRHFAFAAFLRTNFEDDASLMPPNRTYRLLYSVRGDSCRAFYRDSWPIAMNVRYGEVLSDYGAERNRLFHRAP